MRKMSAIAFARSSVDRRCDFPNKVAYVLLGEQVWLEFPSSPGNVNTQEPVTIRTRVYMSSLIINKTLNLLDIYHSPTDEDR